MFLEGLEENQYKESVHGYWHKTDHASQTSVNEFTSSVETWILSFYPSRLKNTVNLSTNPKLRHNFIETPQITKRWKDHNGKIANPCQKPADVSAWIVGSVCMPGSTVLVIGPGAGGGEVIGALTKGCNVVAVEKDEYQFNQLQAHLLNLKERLKTADSIINKQQIDDDSGVSQSFPPGSQYEAPASTQDAKSDDPVKCDSCGLPVLEGAVQCSTEDCGAENWFHATCTVVENGEIICLDCQRHQQQETASQMETQEQE